MGCQIITWKAKFSLVQSYQDDITFSHVSTRYQSTLF